MIAIVNFIWVLIRTLGKFIMSLITILLLAILSINLFAIISTHSQVIQASDNDPRITEDMPIVVLGAGVVNNEYPSQILANRLDKAYELHQTHSDNPLIMSGDHSDLYYNEVTVMKEYLVEKGIDSDQIYLDHEGLSTYASLYRLKEVVGEDQAIIITQGYHLSRALMIANGLDMDVLGIPAEEVSSTRVDRELREILARVKDFSMIYLSYEGETPSTDYGFTLEDGGDSTNIKDDLQR